MQTTPTPQPQPDTATSLRFELRGNDAEAVLLAAEVRDQHLAALAVQTGEVHTACLERTRGILKLADPARPIVGPFVLTAKRANPTDPLVVVATLTTPQNAAPAPTK